MKETLKLIIKTFHASKLKKLHRREMELPINTGKIVTVIGTRRCGKTYLHYSVIEVLLEKKIEKTRILYLNLEDERLNMTTSDLDLILQAYRELYPEQQLEDCYFFFDEIQNVPGWEKFIRRIYDTITTNIFLTGSNSKLLASEIATALRGRTITYTLYPYSFREHLSLQGISSDFYVPEIRSKIVVEFGKFLTHGGYPELLHANKEVHTKTLQEYFNVMLYRDIVERYEIANIVVLKYFAKKMFASVTKPLSITKIYNDLRSNKYETGKDVLYDYLEHLLTAFFAVQVRKFDYSEIKQENLEKKCYVIDNGLASAIDYQFYVDPGKQLENFVALEFIKAGKQISFFKDVKECDFVVHENNGYFPYQVCTNLSDADTRKREFVGLEAACKFLETKEGTIITHDTEGETKFRDINIRMVPAYRYFLEK